MTYDIQAAIAAEVATGPDMTKAQAGGTREVAKAGPTRLRFVGYVEIGKHTRKIKGADKTTDQVELTFELSGKNHPAREHDGKKIPTLIVVRENKSLNEKANFFKLFTKMNWAGKATHMAQLLGESFLGVVSHHTFKGSQGDDITMAQLRGPEGYEISPPFRINEDDEKVRVTVDEAITTQRVFFWNTATKAQWDSLFIDGQYDAEEGKDGKPGRPAKSKNLIQIRIKSAVNFAGSKIDEVLKTNGITLDVGTADVPSDDEAPADETPATPKSADDVLNGIV